ncbi:hypothetical protein A167_01315 [Alcanivorax sp. S71-1-4]|nr:hypothetical protein A167_01315 [Alcanivorax sp. S71-1-4]
MHGYLKVPAEDSYYVLLEGYLARFGVEPVESLAGWPLLRWDRQHVTPEIASRYNDFQINGYPEKKYSNRSIWSLGCLQDSPLRYGPLGEGKYLIIFMANDFVVFSIDLSRIVFFENTRLDDWLPRGDSLRQFESKSSSGEIPYQYLSGILSDTPEIEPGYRGYSKLYFGDFDGDENGDILVWRKLYISRSSEDEVEGFRKIRDEWQHYARDESGEYIPLDTAAGQIQGWLQLNNLTWQKGFPTISECEGEEGQLIPEMHDPLLNDPDVLQ